MRAEELDLLHVTDVARPALLDYLHRLRHTVRLLVVVDTEISLSPGANAFGIERVVRLLRESTVGCLRFRVDVAQRSSAPFSVVAAPTGTNPKYLGFRFNSALPDGSSVLSHYDEVWCFGFKPDNFGASDANISQPGALPASDAELAVLTTWMNDTQGGVFATGDHDYLGASMCHRIPRVGTMRAWTNAQGVPPINTAARIDTNRPANAAEAAGTEVIEFERQSDAKPQPIDWVPWMSFRSPFHPLVHFRRPHPVLCHPTLGPIDVMPDHPHEGVVFDHVAQPDVGLAPISVGNSYTFGAVTGPEYPSASGVQPLPLVIAYGRTLADPPLIHEKGDSPAKRFAMISVYDGHRAAVGRVATDSTWHHWMNINITDLETAGGPAWQKIRRYYLNLAVWLAPARIARDCCHFHLIESLFAYPGIEEFHRKADLMELGSSFRHILSRIFGPCWVSQFVLDRLGELDVKLSERLIERYLHLPSPKEPVPRPPSPCLTCPPPEAFETAVLGGMVRAAAQVVRAEGGIEASALRVQKLDRDEFDKRLLDESARGVNELADAYQRSLKRTTALFG